MDLLTRHMCSQPVCTTVSWNGIELLATDIYPYAVEWGQSLAPNAPSRMFEMSVRDGVCWVVAQFLQDCLRSCMSHTVLSTHADNSVCLGPAVDIRSPERPFRAFALELQQDFLQLKAANEARFPEL